jgi:hypothetical protein
MDANLSDFDKVVTRSGEMNQIKFFAVSLLLLSILALHVTAPQKYVGYIPAVEEPYKVRPAVLQNPMPLVVSLEEAIQRHEENNAFRVATPYIDDKDLCLVEDCSLDLHLFWVKHFFKKFIAG